MTRFVSDACKGEKCWCGEPAEHKVEETIFFDDPTATRNGIATGFWRHPLAAYICHEHFRQMMGPAAGE